MNCQDVVRSLVDYLGGDMGLQSFHELEEHLKGCQDCRGFVNTYQETITLAYRVPLKEVPPKVKDGWRDPLRFEQGPDSPFDLGISKLAIRMDQGPRG